METVEDIGTAVQHIYQVSPTQISFRIGSLLTVIIHFQIYNDGPWRAPKVQVNIQWPHQVANDKPQGKWLLYLTDTPSVDGNHALPFSL